MNNRFNKLHASVISFEILNKDELEEYNDLLKDITEIDNCYLVANQDNLEDLMHTQPVKYKIKDYRNPKCCYNAYVLIISYELLDINHLKEIIYKHIKNYPKPYNF
jgi:hypothetical protein